MAPETRARKSKAVVSLSDEEEAAVDVSAGEPRTGFPKNEKEINKIVNGEAHLPGAATPPVSGAPATTNAQGHIRKSKSGLEWPRKLFHSTTGFVLIGLWCFHVPVGPVLRVLNSALAVLVLADIIRFRSKRFENLYEQYLGFLMRVSEKNQINGVIWFILSAIVCLTFFPRDIAALSIIILSWCDTAASIFGRLFGKYTPPLPFRGVLFADRKSLAGSLAAFTCGALAGYLFFYVFGPWGAEGDLSWLGPASSRSTGSRPEPPTTFTQLPYPQSTASLPVLCIITGMSAALSEAIEFWGLDDNLTMAPLAGLLIWLGLWLT